MWRLAQPCPGGPVLSASLHRCADPHLQGHRPCQRQHGARRKSGPGHLLWVQAPGAPPPCPGLPCDTPTFWWGDAGHVCLTGSCKEPWFLALTLTCFVTSGPVCLSLSLQFPIYLNNEEGCRLAQTG